MINIKQRSGIRHRNAYYTPNFVRGDYWICNALSPAHCEVSNRPSTINN
ncbi:MAG: hypothetical protein SWX82_04730 [Cyanobacteriota bacterium]|nr:hypothetical protein [Cyanobacteriota bacterium]